MRRIIRLTMEQRRHLARVFHCSEKMVYMALTYRKDTVLARKIRHTAVKEFGGTAMVEVPETEEAGAVAESNPSCRPGRDGCRTS